MDNMNIGKPSVDYGRANEIYLLLKENTHRPTTKQEMCLRLGWTWTVSNDRRIRDLISLLATRRPIISTSDQRGYRLAVSPDDYEEVRHKINELQSRIDALEERKRPLIAFSDTIENH